MAAKTHSKVIQPLQKPIKHTVSVPGSKSLMNRALICAALAKGKSVLEHPIYCDDTRYMIKALEKLGVSFKKKPGVLWVYGVNGKFKKPKRPVFTGNAGTTTRFLIPLLPEGTTITGNAHMKQRPVTDLLSALRDLGYEVESDTNCPPVTIVSKDQVNTAISIKGSMSSQYISALLFLAPTLERKLTINISGRLVSKPYVSMTLQVLKQFGISVTNNNFKQFVIKPQSYKAAQYTVEGDASSATYWWTLAAITGSNITVDNIPENTLQPDRNILRVLEKMGCRVEGNTVVGPSTKPKGVSVSMRHMPDAVMSVAMVAAVAKSTTIIKQVSHLAIKETNRLKVLEQNLKALGVGIKITKDSITISGEPKKWKRATINPPQDHRLAMAFAILGLKQSGIHIKQPYCVKKSYPSFWKDLQRIQQKAKNQTIVLTGMPGSGKTTWGKKLAKRYSARFIDIDTEVEKELGMNIDDYIDRTQDWKGFRDVEHKVIMRHANERNAVISTGGGTLIDRRNRVNIEDNYVIFLNAPQSVLLSRLTLDPNRRPGLTGDVKKMLSLLWKQRSSTYFAVADQVYDTYYMNL